MEITGIDHLVITVRDLKASLAFYVGVLGMEPVAIGGRHAVRFGGQKINFHLKPAEFLPAAAHPAYGSQDICLLVSGDIHEIEEELLAKGWPIEMGVVKRTGARGPISSIYVRDPDKNLVELSAYG